MTGTIGSKLKIWGPAEVRQLVAEIKLLRERLNVASDKSICSTYMYIAPMHIVDQSCSFSTVTVYCCV